MSKYELVCILDARLSENDKNDILKQVSGMIEKSSGKVINSTVWIERQKMSFPINKASEGTYYLINMEMAPAEVAKLRRELQLSERVLRFLIVKIEAPKTVAA